MFKKLFDNLHIEFYKNGIEYSPEFQNYSLDRIAQKAKISSFEIYSDLTVSEVCQSFEDHLGVKIRIFRKLGMSSVETSFTSNWTLERQNKIGGELYFQHD